MLLIAHDFPPATGSGSLRALAFARYLPLWGWRPVVLTVGEAWATHRDDALLCRLPAELEMVRTRSLEPRATPRPETAMAASEPARQPSRLRRHLGHAKRFPDAHAGWLPFALSAARRMRFDAIYSTSGPFTSHLVGLVLHQLTRKPWVAELRDGWFAWNRAIFPDYPAWRGVLERRLESSVIRSADRVVLVTDRMADAFRQQYRDLPAQRFGVVPNGYDPVQVGPASPRVEPGAFQLVHAGALYYGRSLAGFLGAAQRLVAQDRAFAQAFRLVLVGSLDAAAQTEVQRAGLAEQVTIKGQVPHAEAVRTMSEAAALLLVANTTPGAGATVPGKLFEYLATGRPIFAVAPRHSSTTDVLGQTGGAWLAHADDTQQIECTLREAFMAHRQDRSPTAHAQAVKQYDRRRLSGQLARILSDVL